ncbi:MAG TPA: hypothetical protein VLA82_07720 [Actinomycetota bacterium]|nr:hypothetical protein [Actinomycetota bacterium]
MALVLGVALSSPCLQDDAPPRRAVSEVESSSPPPAEGYFKTRTSGAWRDLPTGTACEGRVRRSTWEPRPANAEANARMPDPAAVSAALASRSRSGSGGYATRWDTWLLPRVDGAFTGTTDEIIQWAACKWGIADNLLRAIAVRESTWYQDPTYASGRCVPNWGCGDLVDRPTPATRRYCRGLAEAGGHDYEADHGAGICPKTFSIAGVMSWQDPDWGRYPANQNGTFPFNRDSTAFAVDYLAASLRGCIEGWEPWLANTSDRPYRRGDVRGCVGAWFAGAWWTPDAKTYVARVRRVIERRTWLRSSFARTTPPCDPVDGCPV